MLDYHKKQAIGEYSIKLPERGKSAIMANGVAAQRNSRGQISQCVQIVIFR